MATYNGEAWLSKQLDSIINQVEVELILYVSDDNSNDSTLKILHAYADKHEFIRITPLVKRLGSAAKNFFSLIEQVDLNEVSYIALSDQDDIWLPDKLKRAVSIIESNNLNAYSSNVTAFWQDGKNKVINKAQSQKRYDFMFESAGPGCTFVITSALAKDLQNLITEQKNLLTKVALHDWFIYAFARSKGYKWHIDHVSTLMYRQHSENVVGANTGLKAFLSRASKLRQGWYLAQVVAISKILGYQKAPPIKKITRLNLIDRCYLAIHAQQFRRRLRDRLAFTCFVLFFAKKP